MTNGIRNSMNWNDIEFFRSLVEDSTFGSYVLEGNYFQYINPSFAEIFGYSMNQFLEKEITLEDLILSEDLQIVKENINARLHDGLLNMNYRVRAVKQNRNIIHIEIYGNVLYRNGQKQVCGKVLDVTEQVFMEMKLKQSERRYRSLFEYNADAVYQIDLNGKFVSANNACSIISGYSQEELLEITFMPLVVSEDLEKTMYFFHRALEGENHTYEIRLIHKDGKMVYLNCTTIPIIIDGKIDGIYGIVKDITESKKAQERINHMAYYDQLTNLPNRRLFEDRLSQSFLHSNCDKHMMAVMYLDMNRFKYINDSFGHAKGDVFLQKVADRLKSCVNEGTTVARIGGDEFAILLPKIMGEQDALELAEKITSELNKPLQIEGLEVIPNASIGIAVSDGFSDKDKDMLMREADITMYHMKKHNHHYAIYESEMDTRASLKLKLESDLRRAIERNQLFLDYQPIVNLEEGKISSVEALVRWKHPKLGIISPGDFIPIAEETGLIIPIGEWVLRTACEQIKAWQDEDIPPTRVAVNVSLMQLQQADFAKKVETILNEVQLEGKWLDLEITESVLIQNQESIKAQLSQFRKFGIKVSIDDFGTGYTSLNYLKTFLIDHLKIDRSFIQDINLGSNNNAIIASLITLAHNLNINVIAEGIETEDQMIFLKRNGCDEGQGFIISKPVESDKLKEQLAEIYLI